MASDEDMEEEQGGEVVPLEEEVKHKGKRLLIIIIAVVVLLLGGGGAALYFMGFFHSKEAATQEEENHKTEEEKASSGEAEKSSSVYYDMDEFLVNLNTSSKQPSFLKMTISLELANQETVAEVSAKMPRIRDTFQIYLRELRTEDLQGAAGIYRLREELLLRLNKVLYPTKVKDILFKEILVQ